MEELKADLVRKIKERIEINLSRDTIFLGQYECKLLGLHNGDTLFDRSIVEVDHDSCLHVCGRDCGYDKDRYKWDKWTQENIALLHKATKPKLNLPLY